MPFNASEIVSDLPPSESMKKAGKPVVQSIGHCLCVDPEPPPDTQGPVVTVTRPLPAALFWWQPFEFEITNDGGAFALIVVIATYPTGFSEVIHDGTEFTSAFSGQSTRTEIPNGYKYSVRRFNGWILSPKIRVLPVDSSGNTP